MTDDADAPGWAVFDGALHAWCGVCQAWRAWSVCAYESTIDFPDGESLETRSCSGCRLPLVRVVRPCIASPDSVAAYAQTVQVHRA